MTVDASASVNAVLHLHVVTGSLAKRWVPAAELAWV
jgi:hypothetical protein